MNNKTIHVLYPTNHSRPKQHFEFPTKHNFNGGRPQKESSASKVCVPACRVPACSRWGPNTGTPLLADLSMLNQFLVTCMIQLAMIKIVIPVKLVNPMELVSFSETSELSETGDFSDDMLGCIYESDNLVAYCDTLSFIKQENSKKLLY